MERAYDVVIVGAGIAGLTAALYASRQGLKTLVVGADLGGQLLMAPEIQNFPGFESIRGFELIERIESQARLYGAEVIFDEVLGLHREGNFFVVKCSSGEFKGLALILACGKAPKELGIFGEKELRGKGVSYCVVCDAPLFKGKDVALVSWGQHGFEAANMLASHARRVYWVFPGEKPYEDEDAVKALLSRGNVELVPRAKPLAVKGERKVEALMVELVSGGKRELPVDGVFVEVGYEPRTGFLKGFVELNEKGEVVVDKECKSSTPGVFAAGDVTDLPYKQAVIAAGMGAMAALSAYKYVMELKGKKVASIGDWRHFKRGGSLTLKLG